MKKITLLITGSIAAYKSAELVRELVKGGAQVRVGMSRGAKEFVTPLTLQTLSGNPVATDLFSLTEEQEIGHISLADDADLIVVAPATADIIGKAASGIADDLVTTVLLAARCPVIFAPAMNVNMWEHPAVRQNVATLKNRGVRFVEPGVGELACGWIGSGRLADIQDILAEISNVSKKDLEGYEVFVTAGPTEEPLDPVRFLSNNSSGKMGYAIAEAAYNRGADVKLISGPTNLPQPHNVHSSQVKTALEMREELLKQLRNHSNKKRVVIMAAAVSDFRPAAPSATKLKQSKSASTTLELVPNPDILAELGKSRDNLIDSTGHKGVIVGFSVETGTDQEILSFAREKIERKKCDLLVVNAAEDSFGKDTNRIWIIDSGGERFYGEDSKNVLAHKILDLCN
jgi:phosphopantothenoylcysteine decarboxylase/phosphopantothenate--cysteine ligase